MLSESELRKRKLREEIARLSKVRVSTPITARVGKVVRSKSGILHQPREDLNAGRNVSPTSDKVVHVSPRKSVMDPATWQNEKPSTVEAIKRKAAMVGPSYSKGSLQYDPRAERASKTVTSENIFDKVK